MMAAIGIHLERHRQASGPGRGLPSYPAQIPAPTDRSLQQGPREVFREIATLKKLARR
jgi:hypothetical protein